MVDFRDRPVEHVLGRLQDMLVEDVVVRVDEFGGDFQMSPSSDLFRRLTRHGNYEPELARLFQSYVRPDDDVIDVGANIGFFTVAAGKRLKKGRVLAIEPTKGAFTRLQRNVERNDTDDRTVLFNGMASNTSGEFPLYSVVGKEEYSSIGPLRHPSVAGEKATVGKAQSQSLDELAETHELSPALIKVDVEGAEALVFAGASRVLEHHRPVVISEISNVLLESFDATGRDIVAMFEALSYRVIDPSDPRAVPGTKDYGEILCLPAE